MGTTNRTRQTVVTLDKKELIAAAIEHGNHIADHDIEDAEVSIEVEYAEEEGDDGTCEVTGVSVIFDREIDEAEDR